MTFAGVSGTIARMTDKADLPDDIERLKAMLLAERAEKATIAAERDRMAAQNDRLTHILRQLRRNHFGRKSEQLTEDQLNLGLEDLETAIASGDAAAENANATLKASRTRERRVNRGHLPAHLLREEIVIEPDAKTCPCCGGDLHMIGEDRSERLDKIPAKYRVIVTRRPKYACRSCEHTGADKTAGVIQAQAPARLVEGGLPTEALVADVVASKYAWHLPLYRQSQMMASEGLAIDRSTLAHWVGFAAFELRPVYERLLILLKRSGKLFADETRCPVLDPGRGKTKTGYLWAIARDDRPWGGIDPPAVAYIYAPGRGGEHAVRHLAGFSGTLQVDAYVAYRQLADPRREGGPLVLANCWSHFRREFYDIAKDGNAPIATETLRRIAALYAIEDEIRGRTADERQAVRQARTMPLVEVLAVWLKQQLARISGGSDLAKAIRYGLNHWDGLSRFLDDGRIEMDSNTVERSIRPLALSRKNALFAGSDEGADNWACIASLIETCKLNGVNPHTWLTDTLTKLVNRWPAARIDDLMPWAHVKSVEQAVNV
jgi:transposase